MKREHNIYENLAWKRNRYNPTAGGVVPCLRSDGQNDRPGDGRSERPLRKLRDLKRWQPETGEYPGFHGLLQLQGYAQVQKWEKARSAVQSAGNCKSDGILYRGCIVTVTNCHQLKRRDQDDGKRNEQVHEAGQQADVDHGSFRRQLETGIRRGSRADPEGIKRASADHRRGS